MIDNLGIKVKYLRKENGYSLRKFGKICNLSHSYINDIESGRTNPSIQTLQIIADKLNTNMSYLLGESNNQCQLIKESSDKKEYCYNTEDYEIIKILNNNPKIKHIIYELKNSSAKRIDIFLKTWDFVKSISKDIDK
jgi:transcriptional regulator with XRE-family HTH domain